MHEVGGAVQRIDEPPGFDLLAARFFPVHGKARLAYKHVAHSRLARQVGFADVVARRLLADLPQQAEVRPDDVATGTGGAFRDDE